LELVQSDTIYDLIKLLGFNINRHAFVLNEMELIDVRSYRNLNTTLETIGASVTKLNILSLCNADSRGGM